MGKIGDLWVRLGLKSEDYKKGMKEAKNETNSFSQGLGKMKATAVAVWAAIGTSVVSFAKQCVTQSQKIGAQWNAVVGPMKASWSQFLTSLTNWDWNGFANRIGDAMDAAKRSVAAHDAEFEVQNSIKMRKAAMAEELASLDILMRNTQKSYKERAKAAQDYLDKIEPLYKQEIELRKGIYLADTDEYLKNAGLAATADNRDILRKFFTDIAPNGDLIAALVEYQKKVEGKKYKLTEKDSRLIEEFYQAYDNKTGAALSVLAKYYQGTNDKTAQKAIDAIVAYDGSLASFLEETRRVRTIQNSALAQLGEASSATTPMERKDLTLPAVAALTGSAQVTTPDLLSHEWLERQKQVGLEAVEWQRKWLDTMAQATQGFEDSIVASVGNGFQAITDMMFGLEEMDMGAVLAAFLSPFADTMKQMGAMIMSEGIAMEAFKKSFSSPAAAIAAGAALMAIGSAVSSGLQSLISNPTGGGSSYGGSSSYKNSHDLNYESTLTIYVEGKVSGSDILLAGSNQQNKWNR